MHTVAVIPARSGSRRVPDKNIRLLGGHPLIAWTIKAALKAPAIDRVIVSTDSEKYADIARSYGAEVPFIRPASISNDCDTADVVKHCLEFLYAEDDYWTHYAVTLQPTCPFRNPTVLNEACELARVYGIDSIVSVIPVAEHPAWMFRLDGPVLKSFLGIPPRILSGLIAQELPDLYLPDGSIYVTKGELLFKSPPRIYGDSIGHVLLSRGSAVDIEEESDFQKAEVILQCQPDLMSILG